MRSRLLEKSCSYLPLRTTKAESLRRLFRRAYAALRPGGLFVFDLFVSGPPMSYRTWRTGRGWAVLVQVEERGDRLFRHIITFRSVGGRYRRGSEEHVLSVHTRASVLSELRRAGFVARTSRHYGRFELSGSPVGVYRAKTSAQLTRPGQVIRESRNRMEWYVYVARFFAGAFIANAIPHFVSGVQGRRFPTPFSSPPGKGESSSAINVIWGSANAFVGYLLLYRVGSFLTSSLRQVLLAGGWRISPLADVVERIW